MSRKSSKVGRREFLAQTGMLTAAIGLSTWLPWELLADQGEPSETWRTDAPDTTSGGILRLRLEGQNLGSLDRFYAKVLGFETRRTKSRLTVSAGGTELEFAAPEFAAPEFAELARSAGSDRPSPTYHIAWAIPANKLAAGKKWLAARTPLLQDASGRDEFHFRRANRVGVYFADPGGNILELIARHDLGDHRPGGFDLGDLLYINHVGLAVDHVATAITRLRENWGLELTGPAADNFATLGDAHRHLTLVTKERLWIPERTLAAGVYPADILLHGSQSLDASLAGYPYRIRVGSRIESRSGPNAHSPKS